MKYQYSKAMAIQCTIMNNINSNKITSNDYLMLAQKEQEKLDSLVHAVLEAEKNANIKDCLMKVNKTIDNLLIT